MKNKSIIIIILSLICLISVMALDECGEAVPYGKQCQIISPYISGGSATIDIWHINGSQEISSGTMQQIASSGIYNYTMNFTSPGTHVIKLSDDSVRTIIAINESLSSPTNSFWSYLMMTYFNTMVGGW